jgi:hypothetical protein
MIASFPLNLNAGIRGFLKIDDIPGIAGEAAADQW